ncbi:DUF3644 domain-containing protein [Nocardia farcinica]|uniref:DUF3644 domain-containing protein n=1 Tax=Nocardia farcinica TaxID=37329 RepID=UPI001894734B|nr:DUF3644 domain-containing protein [Nocardia farcinica]MBF6253132.1 DUF3644 domain-containing protein [Nocardia farcinica]MBF6264844.1 DUF3644 domain-containing protein [Nocardia farcinica]MBF6283630.1 DUF3644 domain-containing protein [Nocardia farcinica]MBF6307417.1 DUF3644 domain-containing protein [Nocardia farcinica]MBF6392516.1 DUF3644 domain-containing protein [Nocardia farcinica]
MGAPYVSCRRLVDNSMSAMLSAIEIYNKPQITYRDETTVVLVVNAWELALKAALRQAGWSIFYPKKRGEPYRSWTLEHALAQVSAKGLWPDSIDGPAVTANVKALIEYRNRAIHLYNAQGLGEMIYPFLQQNVVNYRDFVLRRFDKDFADSITWQLLPLGAKAPAEAVRFMKVDTATKSLAEVQQFIDTLRGFMDEAEAVGSDMGRVATIYDINMQSVKKMTSADLVVSVSPTGEGRVVVKKLDPNQSHPYNQTELLDKVNQRRKGRRLTSYDYQVLCWKEKLRDNPKYAWKHEHSPTYLWSGDAVSYLAGLDDEVFDQARADYRNRARAR